MGKIVCSIHAQHTWYRYLYICIEIFLQCTYGLRGKKNPLKNHTKKATKKKKKQKTQKKTKKDNREQCSKKEKAKIKMEIKKEIKNQKSQNHYNVTLKKFKFKIKNKKIRKDKIATV